MSKAQLCVFAKRAGIEAAVGYSDDGQTVVGNDCDEVPFVIHGWLGIAYQFIGQPERSVEWYRAELARGRDTHASTRACVVIGLAGGRSVPGGRWAWRSGPACRRRARSPWSSGPRADSEVSPALASRVPRATLVLLAYV